MGNSQVRQQSVRQAFYAGKSGLTGSNEFGLLVVVFKRRK
jgi:hypothetical protein